MGGESKLTQQRCCPSSPFYLAVAIVVVVVQIGKRPNPVWLSYCPLLSLFMEILCSVYLCVMAVAKIYSNMGVYAPLRHRST